MMKKRWAVVVPMVLFALYMFIFLLTEFTVNVKSAIVLGQGSVTAIYSVGIVSTSLGYISFYLSRKLFKSELVRKLLVGIFAVGYLGFTLCFMFTASAALFTTSALLALLLFGYIGGFVHYTISLFLFGKSYSGKVIGIAISAATLLQFTVQNLLVTDIALLISLFLGSIGIVYLAVRPVKDWMFENPLPYSKEPSVTVRGLLLPILIVAAMSVCFGLSDGLVTQLHADGVINLASYERLLYALGVFIAGIVTDIRTRKLLPLCTLCMLVLTAAMALFIGAGNTATNGLYVSVMYLFSGFYVMYLTVIFIDAAPLTYMPDLWAGMGRIVRGVCIGVMAYIANPLFENIGQQGIAIASICIAIVALVLFVASGTLNLRMEKQEQPRDRIKGFALEYKLTPRETDVFSMLVDDDTPNKDIAAALCVSVRVVERYITAISEKTGTRTRVGLVKLYYNR